MKVALSVFAVVVLVCFFLYWFVGYNFIRVLADETFKQAFGSSLGLVILLVSLFLFWLLLMILYLWCYIRNKSKNKNEDSEKLIFGAAHLISPDKNRSSEKQYLLLKTTNSEHDKTKVSSQKEQNSCITSEKSSIYTSLLEVTLRNTPDLSTERNKNSFQGFPTVSQNSGDKGIAELSMTISSTSQQYPLKITNTQNVEHIFQPMTPREQFFKDLYLAAELDERQRLQTQCGTELCENNHPMPVPNNNDSFNNQNDNTEMRSNQELLKQSVRCHRRLPSVVEIIEKNGNTISLREYADDCIPPMGSSSSWSLVCNKDSNECLDTIASKDSLQRRKLSVIEDYNDDVFSDETEGVVREFFIASVVQCPRFCTEDYIYISEN